MDVTPVIDQILVDNLRRRLRIQDSFITSDPAYDFLDSELWEIIIDCVQAFDINYDISTLPEKYYNIVLVLAKKEILWRLALSTAPYYRLEAEGAVLEKNMRFDHYYKLIVLTEAEYLRLVESLGGLGVVESYDVTTKNYHHSKYNYERTIQPAINLTLSNITSNSVNLDWTKFSAKNGKFGLYNIYCETSAIIDPYAEVPISSIAKYTIYDMHKNMYRITGLLPNTLYYVLVVSSDSNGVYGYTQATFTTLSAS